MEILIAILPYLWGGSGLITYGLAYKERRAKQSLNTAQALASIQNVYQHFIKDTKTKFDEMKAEIERLRQTIENSPKPCDNCPNIKK